MKPLGLEVAPSRYRPDPDYVGYVETTASGNTVIGILSWRVKTGHIVLSPDEVARLVALLRPNTEI